MISFQSAYTKFNSTETTLLALHDHIIRAMSQQQATGLCLLDLSAAFDTIDHTIPLHRLKSWFGFTDTVLSWIQSYLSSCSFTVDINGIKSPPSKLLHGDTFSEDILLLQNTITNISSWMASNVGMFYHTIFALILIFLNLIIISHYLLLNSTSNQKLTFFFILIFLSLSSLYWTDPLEL